MRSNRLVLGLLVAVVAVAATGCVVRTATPRARGPHEARVEARDDRGDARVEAVSGWEKLGERWVQGRADRDAIRVGRDDGRYRRLKIVVEHSALELHDVEVVFGDDSRFSPGTRLVFGKGATSRTIDLPGDDRVVRRVELRYGNLPGGGRAQVEIWGLR